MQEKTVRKYQVVEEAEIDLVLICRDSHEFFEQYLKVFPDTKKDPDNISKMWKRRSEFAKKRQPTLPNVKTGMTSADAITLITEQTRIMREFSTLTKEALETNRQILAALSHQNDILTGHTQRESASESLPEIASIRHPTQEKGSDERIPIMIAS